MSQDVRRFGHRDIAARLSWRRSALHGQFRDQLTGSDRVQSPACSRVSVANSAGGTSCPGAVRTAVGFDIPERRQEVIARVPERNRVIDSSPSCVRPGARGIHHGSGARGSYYRGGGVAPGARITRPDKLGTIQAVISSVLWSSFSPPLTLRRGRRDDSVHAHPPPADSAQAGCSPSIRAFAQPSARLQ